MEFKVEDIKHDVRVIIAENENISPLIEDGSIDDYITLERDSLIDNLICKGIDRVHQYAPANMLRDVSVVAKGSTWQTPTEEDFCNRTILPDSFLRLNFVRLPEWRQPVYETTDVESLEYEQAQSPFEIVRPSLRHPMVAIKKTNEGLVLEAYPKTITDESSLNNTQSYIVEKSSVYDNEDSEKSVQIAEACYDAALYAIANLYYVSINEADKAQAMANECADILGIDKK